MNDLSDANQILQPRKAKLIAQEKFKKRNVKEKIEIKNLSLPPFSPPEEEEEPEFKSEFARRLSLDSRRRSGNSGNWSEIGVVEVGPTSSPLYSSTNSLRSVLATPAAESSKMSFIFNNSTGANTSTRSQASGSGSNRVNLNSNEKTPQQQIAGAGVFDNRGGLFSVQNGPGSMMSGHGGAAGPFGGPNWNQNPIEENMEDEQYYYEENETQNVLVGIEGAKNRIEQVGMSDATLDQYHADAKKMAKTESEKYLLLYVEKQKEFFLNEMKKMKESQITTMEHSEIHARNIAKSFQAYDESSGVMEHLVTNMNNMMRKSMALPEIVDHQITRHLIEFSTYSGYLKVKFVPDARKENIEQSAEDRRTIIEYFQSILSKMKFSDEYVENVKRIIKRVRRMGPPIEDKDRFLEVEFINREAAERLLHTYTEMKRAIFNDNKGDKRAEMQVLNHLLPYPIERMQPRACAKVIDKMKDAEAIINETLDEKDPQKAFFLPGQCRVQLVYKKLPAQSMHTGPNSNAAKRVADMKPNLQRYNAAWRCLLRILEEDGNEKLKEKVLVTSAWKTQGQYILQPWLEEKLPNMQNFSNGRPGPEIPCSEIIPSSMIPRLQLSNEEIYPEGYLTESDQWVVRTMKGGPKRFSGRSALHMIKEEDKHKQRRQNETAQSHLKRPAGGQSANSGVTPPQKRFAASTLITPPMMPSVQSQQLNLLPPPQRIVGGAEKQPTRNQSQDFSPQHQQNGAKLTSPKNLSYMDQTGAISKYAPNIPSTTNNTMTNKNQILNPATNQVTMPVPMDLLIEYARTDPRLMHLITEHQRTQN